MWKLPPKKQKGMASVTPDHCRQLQSSQSPRFLWRTLGEGLGGSHLWGKTTLVEWKINNILTHSLCPNLKELEMFSHNITNEILTS